MEYFNEEYENCIFVVASDDIKWAKKHLKQENNQIYFSEQNPTFSLMTDQSPIYKPVMDDDISKVRVRSRLEFQVRSVKMVKIYRGSSPYAIFGTGKNLHKPKIESRQIFG